MKSLIHKLCSSQKFRYLTSGGLSFAIEFAIFMILVHFKTSLVLANTASFMAGLLASFFLHKLWSFAGEQQHQTKDQFVSYALLAIVNLLLSNVIIYWLVDVVSIPKQIAKILVMAIIVCWNYAILGKFIFRRLA